MELITISNNKINNQEIQTVDARELHEFLEVKSNFRDWINNRIKEYGFAEHIDFTSFAKNLSKPQGGRSSNEYYISLDMAKELSMVERNEKGREARQYFIECEKRLKTSVLSLPDFTKPEVAARAWADEVEAKQIAQQKLIELQPKADFVDRYVQSDGCFGFREVCKKLKANEARFKEFLIKTGVMYYLAGSLTAKSNHIETGRFKVVTGISEKNEHAYSQSKFTTKGIEWIAGEWAKYNLKQA